MDDAREQITGTTDATGRGDSEGPTRLIRDDRLDSADPIIRHRDHRVSGLQAGERVGRYLVLEALASGGMSIVYVAYDPELDRRVALKVMRPDVGELPEKAQARLLREAQAMARLTHPNVVRVYDVGVIEQRVYMAMELVDGVTLRDWLKERSRTWREIVDVLVRAGRGLAAAHEAGLMHLDIKPRNIMVGHDGGVRVVDFGLARPPRSSDSSSVDGLSLAAFDDAVTHAGMVMGTPGYMAPEQLGGTPDARSDQFSFCVTAWEALHGRRPYGGHRLDIYRGSLRAGKLVEPPADARVPARVRRLLERGLSIDAEQRWPSLAPLLDALADDPRRRRLRYAAALVLVGATGTGAWALGRGQADPCAEVDSRLVEVWNEERREAVRSHLSRAGGLKAEVTAEDVAQRLDDYAQTWAEESTDACRAAQVEQRQSAELYDLRDYCLQHRLRALRATTETILEAEPDTQTSWRDAVIRLPSVERCRDVTSVHDVGQPPADPEIRKDVERVDAQISRAQALIYAGRNDQAEKVLRPLVAEAKALGHAPLIANAKVSLGESLLQLDRPEEAMEVGFEGMWAADAAQLHRLRLEAAVDLVYNLGVLQGRFDEAERLARWALTVEPTLVGSPTVRAQLLTHLGAIHATAGDPATSLLDYEEALRVRRDAGLSEDLNECATISGIGASALLLGDQERALESFRLAHAIFVEYYGADHPGALVVQENIATALNGMERFEDALEEIDELLELGRSSGVDDGRITTAEATRGAILLDLRRYDEARVELERARKGLEDPLRRPVLLGAVRGNLAIAALEQERFEEAASHAQAGLELLAPLLPPNNFYLAWVRVLLARAELGLGRPVAALEHAAEAMKVFEEATDPVAPDLRSDAALVLARALEAPEVQADPELVARFGGDRTPAQWAARAVAEAQGGGRSAEPMLERAKAWRPRPRVDVAETDRP